MEKQIILPENVELTEEVKTLYKDKDGNLKPGKDGVSFKVDQFPQIARLLADAGGTLKELGLL